MESAACFASYLLELREQLGGTFPRSIPEPDVEGCLQKYAEKRQSRVSGVTQAARFACQTQLKIGPAADAYISSLPGMKNEEWLSLVLQMLTNAEKIEGWEWNSPRVNLYTKNAEKIREKVERKESLFIDEGGGVAKCFQKSEPEFISTPA